jgi:hypothetical protein
VQNQNKNGIVVTSYEINYSEAYAFIFVFHLMPQFFVSNSSSRSIPKFSIFGENGNDFFKLAPTNRKFEVYLEIYLNLFLST